MDFDQRIFQKLDRTPRARPEVRVISRPGVSPFYIKREDKYNYVRCRLNGMRPYFLELLGIEEFESINHVSDLSFYTYGIITSPEGCRLDPSSIFISSNIDDSNDVVVRLNVGHLQKYSVFPGQVVAVKGKSLTGNEILVEALHCMPVVDVNVADKYENERGHHGPVDVLASSGPFDSESGFGILDSVLKNDADVLVLTGPFVDDVGEASMLSPISVLRDVFVPRLEDWLQRHPQSKVVLVPSTRDLTCLNVFPQMPMDVGRDRIYCVGNPGEFFINNCLVAVSSVDTPLELSSEECFYDSGVPDSRDACGELLFQGDRMSRISHHLIFQRTFLPVFPSADVVSYALPEGVSMDVAPDVYIVTSKLRHFSRDVGPSLVVNLGSQSRPENKVMCRMVIEGPVCGRGTKPTVCFTAVE